MQNLLQKKLNKHKKKEKIGLSETNSDQSEGLYDDDDDDETDNEDEMDELIIFL